MEGGDQACPAHGGEWKAPDQLEHSLRNVAQRAWTGGLAVRVAEENTKASSRAKASHQTDGSRVTPGLWLSQRGSGCLGESECRGGLAGMTG